MKKLISHITFLFFAGFCSAQTPYTINITKSIGLPSNSVYSLCQDKEGFIWMTTNDGLVRYDAHDFKSYSNENQTSLAGSSLFLDAYNRIWYQNFDGYLYFVEHDSLNTFTQQKPIDFIPQGITKKHLFLFSNDGIYIYDLKSFKKVKFIKRSYTQVLGQSKDKFYYISDKQIYHIDQNLKEKVICPIPNIKGFWYMTNSKLGLLFVNRNNLTKKIYRLNGSNFEAFADLEIKDEILGISAIENNIWILTSNGASRHEIVGRKIIAKETLFPGKKISSVFKDRDNNHWFTSLLEGVFLVPELTRKNITFPNFKPLKLIESGENYLIGTKNHQLISTDKNFKYLKTVAKGNTNSDVYYLYRDAQNGNIFYSSNGSNLLVNKGSEKNYLFQIAIKEVVKLDEKYYAFAASGAIGLILNPLASKELKSDWDKLFLKNKDVINENFSNLKLELRAKCVILNKESKTLTFATNQGVFEFTPNLEREIKYNKKPFYVQKFEYFKGNILALSTTGNLFEIKKNKSILKLNKILGFEKNKIKQIKKVGDYLLVRSNSILKIFSTKNKYKNSILVDINLSNFDVYDLHIKNQKIIIVCNSGILEIPFQTSAKLLEIPVLKINSLNSINLHEKRSRNILLKNNENNIEIHFSLLTYGKVTQNLLLYRLNDENWHKISGNERILKFASLASGKYKLQFKWLGQKEHIYANQLYFEIETPFYRQFWFLFICLTLGITIVIFYYKFQVKNLKKKNRLLTEKMILEKNLSKSILTSIKSQMNPHFFYNALNTIQSYIFLNDKKNASNYLSKFSNLTRMILEMSDKETISLHEEIKALKLYLELEKMRFEEGFNFTFDIDENIDLDLCRIPSMLIQPYVENAIKHGLLHKEGDKKLFINFKQINALLVVEIIDNGVGRKRSEELNKIKMEKHKSFSSHANLKRLEILNKGLQINVGFEILDYFEGDFPSGTYVKLTIPIQ